MPHLVDNDDAVLTSQLPKNLDVIVPSVLLVRLHIWVGKIRHRTGGTDGGTTFPERIGKLVTSTIYSRKMNPSVSATALSKGD